MLRGNPGLENSQNTSPIPLRLTNGQLKFGGLVRKPVRDMSFTSARRLIWVFAGYQRQSGELQQSTLAQVLLQSIARCLLPKRPGRVEPRAKKRRPKPLALLLVPRCVARERIRARRA
jgi:hypothetical protein